MPEFGESRAPETAIGKAFIRVTKTLQAFGGQTVSQGGTDVSLPVFALFASSRGLDPIDAEKFIGALIRNCYKILEAEGMAEGALEAVLYSAFFTGIGVGEEMAGIADVTAAERWWSPRQQGEMTPYYLGRVLTDLGLIDLAKRARAGHFDDFHAPEEVADGLETLHLVQELMTALWRVGQEQAPRVRAVIDAVMAGEFDATKEESDRWAASLSGQETFKRLIGGEE